MKYTVGVDIGTFETKAVLVNEVGEVEAQAHKPHKMLVPQPGWAEHRPNEDWWGDFCEVTNKILKMSGVKPVDIKGLACSAIGPCMLPVDDHGEPLSTLLASSGKHLQRCIPSSAVLHCAPGLSSKRLEVPRRRDRL